ncbi:MAG: zinc ribbon domain-containing protein [Pyrinomonadaceae bacterium]
MPIYEYKCPDCGNQIEVMQKISEEPLRECPRCQGKLEKQWSLSGFQFKGTGWYVSDYTNRGVETQSKADSGSEAKSESNGESRESEKKSSNGDAPKTSSNGESTAESSNASKPESKSTENKPTAKAD